MSQEAAPHTGAPVTALSPALHVSSLCPCDPGTLPLLYARVFLKPSVDGIVCLVPGTSQAFLVTDATFLGVGYPLGFSQFLVCVPPASIWRVVFLLWDWEGSRSCT